MFELGSSRFHLYCWGLEQSVHLMNPGKVFVFFVVEAWTVGLGLNAEINLQ